MSTLKIIVGVETFLLHQLMSCIDAWVLDEVVKDVAIFNWWPTSHIINELIVVLSAYGSSGSPRSSRWSFKVSLLGDSI